MYFEGFAGTEGWTYWRILGFAFSNAGHSCTKMNVFAIHECMYPGLFQVFYQVTTTSRHNTHWRLWTTQ
jgi:hypothetical protein